MRGKRQDGRQGVKKNKYDITSGNRKCNEADLPAACPAHVVTPPPSTPTHNNDFCSHDEYKSDQEGIKFDQCLFRF